MADGAQLLPFPTLPADAHCVYIHGVQHKISTNDEGTIISQSALDCGGYAALAERFASIEVFAHDTLSEDEINDVAERFSEIQKGKIPNLPDCGRRTLTSFGFGLLEGVVSAAIGKSFKNSAFDALEASRANIIKNLCGDAMRHAKALHKLLLEKLAPRKIPLVIVGHSFGGMVVSALQKLDPLPNPVHYLVFGCPVRDFEPNTHVYMHKLDVIKFIQGPGEYPPNVTVTTMSHFAYLPAHAFHVYMEGFLPPRIVGPEQNY